MNRNRGTIQVLGEERDILGLIRGSHSLLDRIVDPQQTLIIHPERHAVTMTDYRGQRTTHQAEVGSFGDRERTGYACYETGREGRRSYTVIFYDLS